MIKETAELKFIYIPSIYFVFKYKQFICANFAKPLTELYCGFYNITRKPKNSYRAL